MLTTPDRIAEWNDQLRASPPLDILRWALAQANGRAIVSTNFRPYEAVILHLCVQVQPDIPVLWVVHGYNRPATFRHSTPSTNTFTYRRTSPCSSAIRRASRGCSLANRPRMSSSVR